jgi:tetratricopeptide (TPR) repeat protein
MLHRRTAEVLAERSAAVPAEAVAYHYARSDVPHRAVGYLEQAGDQASARHGNAAAIGFYQAAVGWLEHLGQPLQAARVREKLGMLLSTGAQYAEAIACFERAAAAYRAAGDLEASGRLVAQIGRVHCQCGTTADGLAHVEPALALLAQRRPSAALANLYGKQANLLNLGGRIREGLAAAERAEKIARLVGDDESLAYALYMRGVILRKLGRLEEARWMLQQAIPVAEAAGIPSILTSALWVWAYVRAEQGAFAAARQAIDRALHLAEQHGFRSATATYSERRGWIAYLTGDWSAARRDFERAVALGREVGPFWGCVYPPLSLGLLCLAEGEDAAAVQYLAEGDRLRQASETTRVQVWSVCVLAECSLLAGHPTLAQQRLSPWLAPDATEDDITPLVSLMAWAHLDLDRVEKAADLAAQAVTRARAQGRQVVLVDALRVAALAAARRGRCAEAEEALQEGLALARRLGYPYGEARLLQVSGELGARLGQSEPARAHLEQALAIFQRLGARIHCVQVEHDLATLAAGTTSAAPPMDIQQVDLTPRASLPAR